MANDEVLVLENAYSFSEKQVSIPEESKFAPLEQLKSLQPIWSDEAPFAEHLQRYAAGTLPHYVLQEFGNLHVLYPFVQFEITHEAQSGEAHTYSIIVVKEREQKYEVAVTLSVGESTVAFKDLRILAPDETATQLCVSKGNNHPITKRYTQLNLPHEHKSIRFRANDKTLFTQNETRCKHYGRNVWFTAMRVAQLLGADYHMVESDSTALLNDQGTSYYAKLVPAIVRGASDICFPLTRKAFDYFKKYGFFITTWEP